MNASPARRAGAIDIQHDGAIVTLTLNAPWRGNALDNVMLESLATTLSRFHEPGPSQPRCLILRGAGERHFSTGYNLADLLDEVEKPDAPITDLSHHPLELAVRALDALPFPSIAMIRGHAFGAGCELALTCDLRIASAEAQLCMPPAKLGILYSLTGMSRLIELAGLALTKEMLLTALPVNSGRALAAGLVNHVLGAEQLADKAQELSHAIVKNAPLSLRYTKVIIHRHLRPLSRATEVELADVLAMREECFRSEDFRAAVRGFLEKRPVDFQGR